MMPSSHVGQDAVLGERMSLCPESAENFLECDKPSVIIHRSVTTLVTIRLPLFTLCMIMLIN